MVLHTTYCNIGNRVLFAKYYALMQGTHGKYPYKVRRRILLFISQYSPLDPSEIH